MDRNSNSRLLLPSPRNSLDNLRTNKYSLLNLSSAFIPLRQTNRSRSLGSEIWGTAKRRRRRRWLSSTRWSLSASHVMTANPGHYVAVIITAPLSWTSSSSSNGGGAAVKHLKLLRPDDTLLIGHVYRLVSFEEVLREFSSKRHVRLSSLLVKHKEKSDSRRRGGDPAADTDSSPMTSGAVETETEEVSVVSDDLESVVQEMNSRSRLKAASRHYWKPALQSIAEGAGS